MVNDLTVDVIIPAFNASRYIGETIQSVLNQTYQPRKIIVIDDGSTDDTRSIVRSFDNDLIDLISVENGGVSRARNIGIRASSAEYVAFLDADDVWRADKIALQIEALKQHPDAKVVYSGTSLINDVSLDIPDSTGVPYIRCDVFEDILFFERPVFGSASSVMVYRSTLNRTGFFDESMSFSEDVDLWARLALLTHFTYTEEPCVRIRVHQDSVTRSKNWHKDVLVILQHFYYVNKFAGDIDLPEFNLLIHRRRIIRLFFSKNSKISYYFTFCNKFSQMAPFLFKQMGGSVFRVSFEVFKILWEEALSRVKDRLLFSQRLRLFLSEGTLFFSNSKAYNKDCEFNRRKK
jgi:glycosyltransferase involved in cell wall biosynthesis